MKKGFTLVELLGVIVVLSLLTLLTTVAITNLTRDAKTKLSEAQINLLMASAKNYGASNIERLPEVGECYYITVEDLKDEGFLNEELVDTDTLNKIPDNIKIKIFTKESEYGNKVTNYEVNPKSVTGCETLKQLVKENVNVKKNVLVNGKLVDKVYGTKEEQTTMKNYVIYSGQLWEVVEFDNTNHSIKLASPVSLTAIAFGTNNTWNSSWVRKWLNEVFYPILETNDILVDTEFCLDNIDVEPSSYTKMNACTNKISEKVGLLTYEDYIYAKDGDTIQNGGSFLDEDELSWLITPTSLNTIYMWHTHYSNPSNLTTETYYTNTYGQGIRPVLSIKDDVKVKYGEGTRSNPYVLSIERNLNANDRLNLAKVGDYIYLNESNGPANSFTEVTARSVQRTITSDKVRYRIVSINNDGSIKIERADILRNLPSGVYSIRNSYINYYSIDSGSGETSCLYSSTRKYGDAGIYGNTNFYINGCINHNIFNPEEGSGDFANETGENIGYYLNNATNSFYNWYSAKTKSMIIPTTFNLYTSGHAKDYSNLNDNPTASYPNNTNDGSVTANIGLPSWGDLYTGNDLNIDYWFINRYQGSNTSSTVMNNTGVISGALTAYYGFGARPVLTLSPNVYVTGGDGTVMNPYSLDI